MGWRYPVCLPQSVAWPTAYRWRAIGWVCCLGGAVVLVLLDHLGWLPTFVVLVLLILLVSLPVWFFTEPTEPESSLNHAGPRNVFTLALQFVRQPGMWAWIVVIVFYKAGDSFGSAMSKPLLIDLGYTLGQVGWISGGIGMAAGISGALLGGWLVPRLGRIQSLLTFGVAQALSLLGFWWLARSGADVVAVTWVIGIEHLFGGMSTAALFTLMMDACRRPLAGTDYTLQASVQVVIAGFLHSVSGFSASALGYEVHFIAAFCLGLLALLPILVWLQRVPGIQRAAWH